MAEQGQPQYKIEDLIVNPDLLKEFLVKRQMITLSICDPRQKLLAQRPTTENYLEVILQNQIGIISAAMILLDAITKPFEFQVNDGAKEPGEGQLS